MTEEALEMETDYKIHEAHVNEVYDQHEEVNSRCNKILQTLNHIVVEILHTLKRTAWYRILQAAPGPRITTAAGKLKSVGVTGRTHQIYK